MVDLLIPTSRIVDLVVCDDQIPWDLTGEVSGVLHRQQVTDYAHAMGRTSMPRQPLMVYGPDNDMPILIVGDGVTEAAEMEDLALEAIDKQEDSVRRNGRGMDFDEARERAGMPRYEDFDRLFRDALNQNIARRKANWRTEPNG